MTPLPAPDRDIPGRIVIYSLGGTIAMTAGGEAGVTPTLSASDLVGAVPGIAREEIAAFGFRQKPSAHLTFADIEGLADAICGAAVRGARGIVVTLGTDALEEVAFALDLLLELPVPVVVTGAMRNPTLAGADGPANLLAAVRLAGTAAASELGVLVAFNDEIHAARFVTKTHTTSPSTFSSPNTGRVGWLSEGQAILPVRLPRLPKITRKDAGREVIVPIVTMAVNSEAAEVRAILQARPDALVINAFGGGHVVPGVMSLLSEAAGQLPVLLSARPHSGRVLSSTYGYPGGEIDLLARGLIDTGWLGPCKARMLAALAIRNGCATAQLQDLLSCFR